MMINKTNPSVYLKYQLQCFDKTRLKPTNQTSVKVPIVFDPTNKITYYKTLGTGVV